MATIQGIYVALFGRPADPTGLSYFNQATQNGADLTAIGDLASTAEYQTRFQGMDNAAIVTSIYQSLFQRGPEQVGLNFFLDGLANGTLTINNIAIAILDGAQNDDALAVANKIAAANTFTAAIDTDAEFNAYKGDAAAAAARALITPITADNATIPTETDIDAALSAIVGGGNPDPDPVAEFVLTPGYDLADIAGSFRNGGANDPGVPTDFKFTTASEIVIATSSTLGVNDSLVDGSTADNDVLKLSLDGDLAFPTTTNIETLEIDAGTAAATKLDFDLVTGAKTLDLNGALTGLLTLDNIDGTGIALVDGSGLTSVTAGNGISVSFADATGTTARDIIGSGADDILAGGDGADKITGATGDDQIAGNAGADTLDGGIGADTIDGGSNDDTISGGDGNDTLTGGTGNDIIDGGSGEDSLTGGDGNDTLTGGLGIDSIFSGTGADIITGGAGDDAVTLSVDATTDTLVFAATAAENGADTITDFLAAGAGADKLDVSAFLGTAVAFQALADNTIGDGGGGFNGVDSNVFLLAADADVGTSAALMAAIGADPSDLKLAADSKAVIGLESGGNTELFYVTTNSLGEATDVALVGTLNGVLSADLTAQSFA